MPCRYAQTLQTGWTGYTYHYQCQETNTGSSDHCILHDKNPDKDITAFNQALQHRLKNPQPLDKKVTIFYTYHINWVGVVFPQNFALTDYLNSASTHLTQWQPNINSENLALNAQYSHFSGHLNAKSLNWLGSFDFQNALFQKSADFQNALFQKSAFFQNAQFKSWTDFQNARFKDTAYFQNARFKDTAYFQNALFKSRAYFQNAQFKSRAYFKNAQFQDSADFQNAQFQDSAEFQNAQFKYPAYFKNALFQQSAFFQNALFQQSAFFQNALFQQSAQFQNALFKSWAVFQNALFQGWANFESTYIGANAYFDNIQFYESLNLSNLIVGHTLSLTALSQPLTVKNIIAQTIILGGDSDTAEFKLNNSAFHHLTLSNKRQSSVRFTRCQPLSTLPNKPQRLAELLEKNQQLEKATEEIKKQQIEVLESWQQTKSHWDFSQRNCQNIAFVECDLSVADFTSSDISDTYFDACTWATTHKADEKRYQSLYRHHQIISNFDKNPDNKLELEKLKNSYQRLKKRFEDNHDFPSAGDFHYREMQCRYLLETKHSSKLLTWLYHLICDYGENYLKALGWLLGFIFLLPLLAAILCHGVYTDYLQYFTNSIIPKTLTTALNTNDSMENFKYYLTNSLTDIQSNGLQFLLITFYLGFFTLLSLFIISLRRRFRKK